MSKKVMILSVLSVFLLFPFVCAAQQGGGEAANQDKAATAELIVINVTAMPGPPVISMIKMFEDEPNIGENVTVNYSIAASPDVLRSRLLSGEADIATVPTNLAAKLFNKGVYYQMAAVFVWGGLSIVGSETEINKWGDLKGHTIYTMGKGATPDIILRHLLIKNGIDPGRDVTLKYVPGHVELAKKMIAGMVDVAMVSEPFATKIMKKNKDMETLLNVQKEWKRVHGPEIGLPRAVLVVKKDLAKNHPDVVARFLQEYEASINWINKNPAKAGMLVEKHAVGMSAKVVELSIPNSNIRFMDAIEAKAAVKHYLTILKEFSPAAVGGKLPDEGFYLKR